MAPHQGALDTGCQTEDVCRVGRHSKGPLNTIVDILDRLAGELLRHPLDRIVCRNVPALVLSQGGDERSLRGLEPGPGVWQGTVRPAIEGGVESHRARVETLHFRQGVEPLCPRR